MKKIVITGGPHAGKSTLINKLRDRGFTCVNEAALEVIDELTKQLGMAKQVTWRETNQLKFQELVTRRQLNNEKRLETSAIEFAFLDRGVHDGLGYILFNNLQPSNDYQHILEQTKYDKIFMLDVIMPFSIRADTGRILDQEAALLVAIKIREAYERFGYDVISVPQLAIDRRVDFILERLVSKHCPCGQIDNSSRHITCII